MQCAALWRATPACAPLCDAVSSVLDSSGEEEGSRERSWRAIDIDAYADVLFSGVIKAEKGATVVHAPPQSAVNRGVGDAGVCPRSKLELGWARATRSKGRGGMCKQCSNTSQTGDERKTKTKRNKQNLLLLLVVVLRRAAQRELHSGLSVAAAVGEGAAGLRRPRGLPSVPRGAERPPAQAVGRGCPQPHAVIANH